MPAPSHRSTDQPAARFEPLEPRRLLSGDTLNILALGDSVTLGIGSIDQSYRAALADRLDRDGVDYDFLGQLSDGTGYDNEHFSIQGSRAADSYTNSSGVFRLSLTDAFRTNQVLDSGDKPNVILLHIGINTARFDPNRAADELRTLLEEMADQWRDGTFDSDVQVLLAQIVPGSRGDNKTVDPAGVARTQQYNDRIPGIVASLSDRGFANRITIVDFFEQTVAGLDLSSSRQRDAQIDGDPWVDWFGNIDEANPGTNATGNPDLMRNGDWLHPTPAGYDVMGAIWYRALDQQGLLDGTSTPTPTPEPEPEPEPEPVTPPPSNPAPTPSPGPTPLREDLPGDYYIEAGGDFDGDGDRDLLFRDRNSNATLIRLNENGTVAQEVRGPNVSDKWRVKARHDFNDDGKDDFLWTSSDKKATIWLMDGTDFDNLTAQQNVPQGARFGGIQDSSDNPRANAEVTWNFRRGTLVWQMNNGNLQRVDRSGITSRPNTTPRPSANTASTTSTNDGYRIVLNADLDADGRNDRVWQNADTATAQIRYGNGTVAPAPTTEGWLSPRPAADLDGDGDLDVPWFSDGELFLEWRFEDGELTHVYYPIFLDTDGSISPRLIPFVPNNTNNPADDVVNDRSLGVLNNWGGSLTTRDVINDQTVGQGDLDLVLNHWGSSAQVDRTLPGDANLGGSVNQSELDRVLNNWGSAATFAGSGTLNVDLSGTGLNAYDEVTSLDFAGSGDTLTIAASPNILGSWDTIGLLGFGTPGSVDVAYNPTSVVLTFPEDETADG
ncbi:MAG: SGNH/GDSL hydrolase family protein [Planctomycetota bacterium]